ncbi:MAG TPA: HAMP domain-containing sensor histidine kinase [Streptosporangiaceae bacterium]|nr:HAMP domain-containing sensor histidine kinase [Streptosporangiaceae bacterium]
MRSPAPLARALQAPLARASLRVRVMAVAVVLVAVTSLLMGLLGTVLLRGYLFSRVDAQLRSFSAFVSRVATHPRPGPRPRRTESQLPTDYLVEVVGPGRQVQVLPGSMTGTAPPELSTARLHGPAVPFTAAATGSPGHSWRVLARPVPGGRYVVAAFSLDEVQNTVGRLELADTVAGVAAIVLLAGIGLPLIRASLAPLSRIEDTAAAIATGELSRRIPHPPEHTEVGRLAAALNVMLGRIEASYRAREDGESQARDSEGRMRRFVADASHELRTPLTSVKGLAEFYLQQGDAADRAEVTRLMTGIKQEADRMGRLVEDLLLLARFDQHRPLDLQPVDLSSIAVQAAGSARAIHPARPLTVRAPAPVIVRADAGRLRQVLDNLVGNALQHTPAGTPVTLTVTAGAGHGLLSVADAGPGLSATQAARVFDRFYRTDRARSRASGGTGLGLSIAATLVAAHGGTIRVDTRPGRGATFVVRLPLAAAAAAGGPADRGTAGGGPADGGPGDGGPVELPRDAADLAPR